MMARRSSLNRRSSRSSRYTGSAILDPDTNVVDNTYPYWWENLENNTAMRPSVGYGALNETSPQLNSTSQVETEEEVDKWWKILETSDSLKDIKVNIKKGTPKNILLTSESEEEEPRIKRTKLPLHSKAKTHQSNAFFNILNDFEDTPTSGSIPKARKKSSANNVDSNNEANTNTKQLAEMHDSSSNQSSSSNNILKSKPAIFRKVNKKPNKNVFIDVLQNNELKVPLSKTSSISESHKIIEQKKFNFVQTPVDNQSESTEGTLSFESASDYSHLPVPKAQSTALEDSTSNNSSKIDSSSDIEPKVIKQKPKSLKRPARSINKSVFKNIFIAEENEEEAERSTLKSKNIKENTKITKRPLVSSPNDSSKISRRSQKNVINEDEDIDIDISRSRKRRKSAVLAETMIKNFGDDFIGENIVTDKAMLDNSIAISTIPKPPRISLTPKRKERTNLKEATSTSVNTRTRSLNSSDNIKRKNTQRSSTSGQNVINDKNVSEVCKDVVNHPNDKLQSVYKEQENISQKRFVPIVLSSFTEQDRENTKYLSRLSHRTSNLASSVKENENINVITSNVDDKDGREADKEISNDSSNDEIRDPSFVSSFTKKPDSMTNNSRPSIRNSLRSSVRRVENMDANTSNVNGQDARSEDINDINNEETINQLQYVDKNTSALHGKFASVSSSNENEHHNTKNRSTSSHRVSNIALSSNKVKDKDTNILNSDDKNVREEQDKESSDSSDEDFKRRFRRLSKKRPVANISSSNNRKKHSSTGNRGRVSSRTSNLQLSAKEITQTNSSHPNVGVKDVRETEDEAIFDVNYKEPSKISEYANKEQQNISKKRSIANISSSNNRKKHSSTGNRGRVSSRTSNLQLSAKESTQTNSSNPNVGGKDIRETEDEAIFDVNYEEAPKTSQYANKEPQNISQKSVSNTPASINGKQHGNTNNRSPLSHRISNLVSSEVQMNIEVPNTGIEEIEEDSPDKEVPNGSQHPDENIDPLKRKSGTSISSSPSRKEQDNVESRKRAAIISHFLGTPTNRRKLNPRGQMFITSFFTESSNNSKKQVVVDKKFAEKMDKAMEKIKEEVAKNANTNSQQCEPKTPMKRKNINKEKSVKQKKKKIVPKKVNKAYLVNGNVYRVPRLPRPKMWVTDHLYNHLWKVMEPKFKLETRVISEKFVRQLAEITSSIAKQKSYEQYEDKVSAVMKEMARLGIIRTRFDFYNFCRDFFPYDLRIKLVPMLLPGNKRNIPYDPSKLYEPLLNS